MNVAVRYVSRGGNTRKLAEAMAQAAGVTAQDCSEPLIEPTDLLFLGGSLYWGGVDKSIKQFIAELDPTKVKCVAVFGTAALVKEPDQAIEKQVQAMGIPVAKEGFHCYGEFSALHKGRPNSDDLRQAAAFAQAAMKAMQ